MTEESPTEGFDARIEADNESMDLSPGMEGGIGTVTLNDAVHRITAFCTSPTSGWQTYDLAGAMARTAGHFDELSPWSLLWADTLGGRLSVPNLAGFTLERREDLAGRLAPVPRTPLANLNDTALDALTLACKFGYPGVWAPKITKMLALYRPEQIPVLDGYVAIAMGFQRTGFSEGIEPRRARIWRTLRAMRSVLREQEEQMAAVRKRVRAVVPDVDVASDSQEGRPARIRRRVVRTLLYALMIALSIFFIFPVVAMIVLSLQSDEQKVIADQRTIWAFIPRSISL